MQGGGKGGVVSVGVGFVLGPAGCYVEGAFEGAEVFSCCVVVRGGGLEEFAEALDREWGSIRLQKRKEMRLS